MSTTKTQPTQPWDLQSGALIAGLVYLLGLTALSACGWWLAHRHGWPGGWRGAWSWWSWSLHSWDSGGHIAGLRQLGGWWLIAARSSFALSICLPLPLAAWLFVLTARPAIPTEAQIAGRRLSESPDQAAREMLEESEISGGGLDIHPEVPISLDRETRHIICCGSTGGGKTVMLLPIILQAIDRPGDKSIIYDNKGEFTAILPPAPGAKSILTFAPWDKRCVAWDIAADCTNKSDARTIASRLVPESDKDPLWGLAAQSILVSVVVKYQQERPGNWDFQDVLNDVFAGYDHLRGIVLQYNKEGLYAVEDAIKTKTTQSFLITLSTFLSQIADLAEAWKGKQKFSLRRWLLNPESPENRSPSAKYLVLQGNKRYAKLEQAYIQSIIAALASIINSPELPDSTARRLWLFLDEFPQLGKLPEMSQFFEIGRSKGARVVIGLQDIAQVKDIYGRDTAEAWSSMVGTYLVARTQGRETPRWLSELIGNRRIRRYRPSYSADPGAGRAPQRTDSWEEVEEPVIRPEEITTGLGSRPGGVVQALFFPGGENVYRLTWPYPSKTQRRPAVIPAPWTQAERTKSIENPTEKQTGSSGAGVAQEAVAATVSETVEERGTGTVQETVQETVQPAAAEPPETSGFAPEMPEMPEVPELAEDAAEQGGEQAAEQAAAHIIDAIAPGAGALLEAVAAISQTADTVAAVTPAPAVPAAPANILFEALAELDDEELEEESC